MVIELVGTRRIYRYGPAYAQHPLGTTMPSMHEIDYKIFGDDLRLRVSSTHESTVAEPAA